MADWLFNLIGPNVPLRYRRLLAQRRDGVGRVAKLFEQGISVLTEPRRRPPRMRVTAINAHRGGNATNVAMLGVLEIEHELLFGDERIVQRLAHVVDRSDRDLAAQA
jgi:hypothetical protein